MATSGDPEEVFRFEEETAESSGVPDHGRGGDSREEQDETPGEDLGFREDGGELPEIRTNLQRLLRALAALAVGTTLLQLVLGGIVTSMRAGDTDPDWNPFQAFDWLREVTGGQWYELRHRVLGGLIGILAIALFLLGRKDGRRMFRRLSSYALWIVILQGVLGGVRVLVVSKPELRAAASSILGEDGAVDPIRVGFAMAHALFAQVTLALFLLLGAACGKAWYELPALRLPADRLEGLRKLAWRTTLLLFLQLLLGAFARHAVYPKPMTGYETVLVLHAFFAILVTGLVAFTSMLSARELWGYRLFRRPAVLALIFVLLQLALGLGAWLVTWEAEVASLPLSLGMFVRGAHLLNGALLLAAMLLLTLRLGRAIGPTRTESRTLESP